MFLTYMNWGLDLFKFVYLAYCTCDFKNYISWLSLLIIYFLNKAFVLPVMVDIKLAPLAYFSCNKIYVVILFISSTFVEYFRKIS